MPTVGEEIGLLVKRPCQSPECDNNLMVDVEVGTVIVGNQREQAFLAESYCAVCQELVDDAAHCTAPVSRDDEFIFV